MITLVVAPVMPYSSLHLSVSRALYPSHHLSCNLDWAVASFMAIIVVCFTRIVMVIFVDLFLVHSLSLYLAFIRTHSRIYKL